MEEPRDISIESEEEQIQASPATSWSLFQAASVWHMTVSDVRAGGMRGGGFVIIGLGKVNWALSHSLHDTIALLITCCCVRFLDSKTSWFLLSQRPQQIQGNMLEVIPTGGRLIRREEDWSSSLKETLCEESKFDIQGVQFQTLTANGQRNSKWTRVSRSPHREQPVFLLMFLRRRLSPVGKQFLAHFQRNILSFGSSGGDQMFFCQFHDSLSKSVLVDWILESCVVWYPDLAE